MAVLTVTADQVLALVQQLPTDRRTWLFRNLLLERWPAWAELAEYGDQRAQAVAAERGCDWDSMTHDERERFVDDLLHE